MAKVLLVEDDPLMVRMYQRKLVNDGYEAVVAVDGEDGLVKIRSFRPDLVLLDIMMPKLNGLQVLERLKSDPTTSQTPVVILTNLGGTQDDIERGLELGAVAYLVKSAYRPDEVLAKVKEVLAGYTHSREIPKAAVESLGGAARVLETTEQAAAKEAPKKAHLSAPAQQTPEYPKEANVDSVQAKKSETEQKTPPAPGKKDPDPKVEIKKVEKKPEPKPEPPAVTKGKSIPPKKAEEKEEGEPEKKEFKPTEDAASAGEMIW